MKINIGDIIVPLMVLLSGINVALMNVIDYSLRLKIIIGLAIFFSLIILFIYIQNKRKNRKE